MAARSTGPDAARRIIRARHDNLDAILINAEISRETFAGRFAGHDNARQSRQQAFLDGHQRCASSSPKPVSNAVG